MTQHQTPQSIMNQIKDAGYQCWIHIYSPLFWILFVFINHWKLHGSNKSIIDDNFTYNHSMPSLKNPVHTSNNQSSLPPPPPPPPNSPPRIAIRRPSSLQQQQQHLSNKQILANVQPTTKKKALMLPPKPKSSSSTPLFITAKRKQTSFIFASWKQREHQHQHCSPPLPQHRPGVSFLRRLSSGSSSSTNSGTNAVGGNITKSEPSSPSILKSFSWKIKRQNSDSLLETERYINSTTAAEMNSKQRRITYFKKKTTIR